MGLKAVVDTLDGVPEAAREYYTKADDGKYRLDAEGFEDASALKGALHKEREERKKYEKLAKRLDDYGDLSPEELKELRELRDRMNGDEDTKAFKEGRGAEVISRHTEKMRKDFDKQLKAKEDAIAAAEQKAQRWTLKALDSSLREAASKVGLHAAAVEDAVLQGRTLFSVDDDGNAVQLRDGAVVMGKDGKTPFGPAEWLESVRESKPHWFPASGSGTGAAPGSARGSGVRGKTIKRDAFQSLSPMQRAQTIKEGVTVID